MASTRYRCMATANISAVVVRAARNENRGGNKSMSTLIGLRRSKSSKSKKVSNKKVRVVANEPPVSSRLAPRAAVEAAQEIRQPEEESSWVACYTTQDPAVEKAREELASFAQYISDSFTQYLDDVYHNENLDEYSETMEDPSIPSTVFVPGSLRDRIKLKSKSIRRSLRRNRSSGKTIFSSLPSSSFKLEEENPTDRSRFHSESIYCQDRKFVLAIA